MGKNRHKSRLIKLAAASLASLTLLGMGTGIHAASVNKAAVSHPNIVATLDLFQDAKGDYCEVMEYCAGGDLFTLIIASGKLEYMEADCFFKQLIKGVVYMHDVGVCHRDLKPENLLLTSNGILKITDFGNSE